MRDSNQLCDAMTAAMAMVPNLYSRNRMFALFTDPVVRRARVRARLLRGLVRVVGREDAEVEVSFADDHRAVVRYRNPHIRFTRTVQLHEIDLALLRVILAKGPRPPALAEQPGDRARVDHVLALLGKEVVSSVA